MRHLELVHHPDSPSQSDQHRPVVLLPQWSDKSGLERTLLGLLDFFELVLVLLESTLGGRRTLNRFALLPIISSLKQLGLIGFIVVHNGFQMTLDIRTTFDTINVSISILGTQALIAIVQLLSDQLGDLGYLGTIGRANLTWQDPVGLPNSMIIKFPATDALVLLQALKRMVDFTK